MEIDYSKYSNDELFDVLNHINGEKYPGRLQQVKDEIERRKSDPEFQKSQALKAEQERYHTFWRRFFAQWVDGIVLIPLSFIGIWIMKAASEQEFVLYLWQFISSIAVYIYTILMHGYFGQTVGKMACGVIVMDKSETHRINFMQALYRDCVPLTLMLLFMIISNPLAIKAGQTETFNGPPVIMILFGSLNIIWSVTEIVTMLSNNKRRAFHDFLAGSVVVRI